ncbi:MAG: division/cell wall cluster transcriptional repressor MraZ [Pseudomonadota bacterium]|nr:division/cell wall cluster transcriptional repressor MraZ [Pseudomonadota bacterium]
MFRGINPVSLDAKGRLAIPAKYRDRLRECCAGKLVITIDHGPCLLIYPLPEWEIVEQDLKGLSSTHRRSRNLKRLLLGHAEDCDMDSHGRILLPPPLRTFARLERRVVLVGQGNKFELWNEQAWYQLRDQWLLEGADDRDLPVDLESLSF